MGYHPHGVVSVGAFVAFATNGAKLCEHCPGLDFRLCTLPVNFKIPFLRELGAWLGIVGSSREAIARQLRKPGTVVAIVVGGAREALAARPGTEHVHLVTRKGFVREALLAQATLVPCFSFGENDVYDTLTPKGVVSRLLHGLQKRGLWAYGYSMPIFWGFVPYTPIPGGIQPKPERISLAIGRPLPIPSLGTFEDEGKLEIVFKERQGKDFDLAPFGFKGQAATGETGMVVARCTRDPRVAWGVQSLERGMLLTKVDGKDVTTLRFSDIEKLIEDSSVPVAMTFTDGLVATWHAQYMDELKRVHDSHECSRAKLVIS